MANVDEEIKALQKERESGIVAAADAEGDAEKEEGGDDADGQVALTGAGAYDRDIYGGGGDKFAGYVSGIKRESRRPGFGVFAHVLLVAGRAYSVAIVEKAEP